MKKCFYLLIISILPGLNSYGQPDKSFYLFLNPISIAFRNPTAGINFFIKKNFIDAVTFEGSYMFKDNKIGGFLSKGFEIEKSGISPFTSYPRNKYPVYVYNGANFRIGACKFFHTSKIHQYTSISAIAKLLYYDSLLVNYNNDKHEKRTSIYEPVGYTTHYRTQSEKMKSVGLGLEYGLMKTKENIIINFFIRMNLLYSVRNIAASNEQYNEFYNGNLISNTNDQEIHNYHLNIFQLRPQIGLRIGLTNF